MPTPHIGPVPSFFDPTHSIKDYCVLWTSTKGLRKAGGECSSVYKPRKSPPFSWGLRMLPCCWESFSFLCRFCFFSSLSSRYPLNSFFFRASEGNHPNSYYFIRQPISIFLVKINCFRLWISMALSSSIKQISPTIFYL